MSYSKKQRMAYVVVLLCVALAAMCCHIPKTTDIESIILGSEPHLSLSWIVHGLGDLSAEASCES